MPLVATNGNVKRNRIRLDCRSRLVAPRNRPGAVAQTPQILKRSRKNRPTRNLPQLAALLGDQTS
jgi:hypothetical protein